MLFPHSADQPIFVDDTQRRRRLVVAGGTAAAIALALATLALVSGFTTAGQAQVPAWPNAERPGQPAVLTGSSAAEQSPSGQSPTGQSPSGRPDQPGQDLAAGTGTGTATLAPAGGSQQPPATPSPSSSRRKGGTRW